LFTVIGYTCALLNNMQPHIKKYSSRDQNITKAVVFTFILFSVVIVGLQRTSRI